MTNRSLNISINGVRPLVVNYNPLHRSLRPNPLRKLHPRGQRMKTAIIAALILTTTPAQARSHCFSHWYYPWPQHCGVVQVEQKRYVEVATSPLQEKMNELNHQQNQQKDLRTPSQIQDQADHDAAIAAHKDELNHALHLMEEIRRLQLTPLQKD